MADICPVDIQVDNGSWLVCSLPAGHDGPHYDEADDITFKKGRPDGVQ